MAVQAPLFHDNLGYAMPAANPGFGLSEPFMPLQVDSLLTTYATPPTLMNTSNLKPVRFSNQLHDEFERQTREIDAFLQLQSERLRSAIQHQNKKQMTALMSSIESSAVARVRKTEQDLLKAARRNRELEEWLRRTEMEAEAWKRMAKENEATVLGLNDMLVQARERLNWAASIGGPAQDAESVCECDWAQNSETELQDNGTRKMRCKGCETQRSCVLFLPCNHLCACRQCETVLGRCPVCESVKEGSIEVFYD